MAMLGQQSDPGIDLIPIVPNDNADLPRPARCIRCRPDGAAGEVQFVTAEGTTRTTAIAVGELLPVNAVRVLLGGTTATGLEALV